MTTCVAGRCSKRLWISAILARNIEDKIVYSMPLLPVYVHKWSGKLGDNIGRIHIARRASHLGVAQSLCGAFHLSKQTEIAQFGLDQILKRTFFGEALMFKHAPSPFPLIGEVLIFNINYGHKDWLRTNIENGISDLITLIYVLYSGVHLAVRMIKFEKGSTIWQGFPSRAVVGLTIKLTSNNTFSGLMSRWTMLLEWRYSMPRAAPCRMRRRVSREEPRSAMTHKEK